MKLNGRKLFMSRPKSLKYSLILMAVMMFTPFAAGQGQSLSWGANLDFELRAAGPFVSPAVNATPTEHLTFYTPNLRLFATVDATENLWFNATLQADYYGSDKLSQVFFSLINVNWMPLSETDLTVQAGRFIMPFDIDSRRLLSADNPFAHLSLASEHILTIDKKIGYFRNDGLIYRGYLGQAMVYPRRYTQGISLLGSLGESRWLEYNLALTTASASSFLEYGQHSRPAFIGRVTVKPFMWLSIGGSLSEGPYMMPDNRNAGFSADDLANRYTQLAWSADLNINYSYFDFTVQYTFSDWSAPYVNAYGIDAGEDFQGDPPVIWDDFVNPKAYHVLAENTFNFPFWPGTYLAARYENIKFNRIRVANLVQGTEWYGRWMHNYHRVELVLGKRVSRNVIVKLSGLNGFTQYSADEEDWVASIQISTLF